MIKKPDNCKFCETKLVHPPRSNSSEYYYCPVIEENNKDCTENGMILSHSHYLIHKFCLSVRNNLIEYFLKDNFYVVNNFHHNFYEIGAGSILYADQNKIRFTEPFEINEKTIENIKNIFILK